MLSVISYRIISIWKFEFKLFFKKISPSKMILTIGTLTLSCNDLDFSCHRDANFIRKCILDCWRSSSHLLHKGDGKLYCFWGIEIDLDTSDLVKWDLMLAGRCFGAVTRFRRVLNSSHWRCWLYLSGVGLYHLITRSRKTNIDWGNRPDDLLTDLWQIRHGCKLK
jgi:hypothetical protein